MKNYAQLWKEELSGQGSDDFHEHVDIFESQIALKKQGKFEDKLFAETRLRLGLYGQRYDNGKRYDGIETRELNFPQKGLTKGPETEWDAPGMVRIKIPYGGVTPEQLEVIAELSEEYSDGVSHITTRQDIQLHFVHLENTPILMRRLAAVGITTKEACGNSVRNVTACQVAGVCKTEAFDVTPYAIATYRFLLGHPDTQDFGRKFKIAFSGCHDKPCALVNMHDLGCVAEVRTIDGVEKKGFKVVVGGGLGAVPQEAKVLYDFLPDDELLPVCQSVCRIFSRLGEKKNRAMARIKFLIKKLGIEEFIRLVEEERKILRDDPKWLELIDDARAQESEVPSRQPSAKGEGGSSEYLTWVRTNVLEQKQENYATVLITVPLGDLSADQMRGLADLTREYYNNAVRFSIEQNVVFRWIPCGDLPAFYESLKKLGLEGSHAGTITDITACPGTDTCKLGTSSSRGLADELSRTLQEKVADLDPEVEKLRIKISGCFNSCGQHHLAPLGFYGVSRKKDSNAIPFFQVVLGGRWSQDDGSYGLPIQAIPSKSVPAFVDRICEVYVKDRQSGESFPDYIQRLGKKAVREIVNEFAEAPSKEERPDYYVDWADARAYTTDDKGVGECAGEVVTLFEIDMNVAERQNFDGQIALDEEDYKKANTLAGESMVSAAKAMVKLQYLDVVDQPQEIMKEFKERYVKTGVFQPRFAEYLFRAVESPHADPSQDDARQSLQESHLFIEESLQTRDQAAAAGATK